MSKITNVLKAFIRWISRGRLFVLENERLRARNPRMGPKHTRFFSIGPEEILLTPISKNWEESIVLIKPSISAQKVALRTIYMERGVARLYEMEAKHLVAFFTQTKATKLLAETLLTGEIKITRKDPKRFRKKLFNQISTYQI